MPIGPAHLPAHCETRRQVPAPAWPPRMARAPALSKGTGCSCWRRRNHASRIASANCEFVVSSSNVTHTPPRRHASAIRPGSSVEDGQHRPSGQQVGVGLGGRVGRFLRAEDYEGVALRPGPERTAVAEPVRISSTQCSSLEPATSGVSVLLPKPALAYEVPRAWKQTSPSPIRPASRAAIQAPKNHRGRLQHVGRERPDVAPCPRA